MDYDDLRAKALILQSRDLEIAEFHAMQLPLAAAVLSLLDEIAAQYRAGFEAAREAAAKVCESPGPNNTSPPASNIGCAIAIRALQPQGGEK